MKDKKELSLENIEECLRKIAAEHPEWDFPVERYCIGENKNGEPVYILRYGNAMFGGTKEQLDKCMEDIHKRMNELVIPDVIPDFDVIVHSNNTDKK